MLNVDVGVKILITVCYYLFRCVAPSVTCDIHYLPNVKGYNFIYFCHNVVFNYDKKRNKLPSTQLAGVI